MTNERRKFRIIRGGKDQGVPQEPHVSNDELQERKKLSEKAVEQSVRNIAASDLYTKERAVRLSMAYAASSLDYLQCEGELARRALRGPLQDTESRLLAMLESAVSDAEKGEYIGLRGYLAHQAEHFSREAELHIGTGEEAAQVFYEAARNIGALNNILPASGDPIPRPQVAWENPDFQTDPGGV